MAATLIAGGNRSVTGAFQHTLYYHNGYYEGAWMEWEQHLGGGVCVCVFPNISSAIPTVSRKTRPK